MKENYLRKEDNGRWYIDEVCEDVTRECKDSRYFSVPAREFQEDETDPEILFKGVRLHDGVWLDGLREPKRLEPIYSAVCFPQRLPGEIPSIETIPLGYPESMVEPYKEGEDNK